MIPIDNPRSSEPFNLSPRLIFICKLVFCKKAQLRGEDDEIAFLRSELLDRRTVDTALRAAISAFQANTDRQELGVACLWQGMNMNVADWYSSIGDGTNTHILVKVHH